MKNPETELQREDFERIDVMLNEAERYLLTIAAENGVLGARIERWRWDLPEIVMSWGIPWDIARNIRLLVEKRATDEYAGLIDMNAWHDQAYAGIATQRLWNNKTDGPYPLPTPEKNQPYINRELESRLRNAYRNVSTWGMGELERVELFSHEP